MWTTRLIIPFDKTSLLGNLAKKHKVTLVGYPLSYSVKSDHINLITSGYIDGNKSQIARFISELRKERRLINLDIKGSFVIMEIEQHISNKMLFQPGIINVAPPLLNKDGEYIFELASWDKEKIMKIIKSYAVLGVKVSSIKQKKITNIQITSMMPQLTEKQKKCLQVAIENGYYGYPRRIELKKLAKIVGISYSTYQFHLRVAEKKVMPSISLRI